MDSNLEMENCMVRDTGCISHFLAQEKSKKSVKKYKLK
jgi:hypothetical protein